MMMIVSKRFRAGLGAAWTIAAHLNDCSTNVLHNTSDIKDAELLVGETQGRKRLIADRGNDVEAGEVILVVENDVDVRAVSVEALRELGYTVIDAISPEAALLQFETNKRIDLLFTDVVMPGKSGKQLAERGLAQRPALKVLYTTGYSRNAIVH